MADGSVQVELSVDEQKALKALTSLTKKFEDFGDSAKNAIKKGDIALATFAGNIASSAVSKGFDLLTGGVKSLVGNIEDAIISAGESQKAINNLNVTLAQTGAYTKQGAKAFAEYADAVEKTTGISGEAVLQTASFIQQVNKLSQKELKQATQATIDFASAYDIDLNTATNIVSKAIDGNVSSLKKYGIEVNKSIDSSNQFSSVITALSSVSGSASEKVKTFSGGWDLFKTTIDDFRKSIGFLIVDNPAVVKALSILSGGISSFANIINENKSTIIQLINSAFVPLITIGSSATLVIIELADSFIRLTEAVRGNAMESSLEGLKNQLKEIREVSQNFIDPNTGEKIKSTGEQWLEIQIQQAETALAEQRGYAKKRAELFDTITEKVKEVENGLVTVLSESVTKQNEAYQAGVNKRLELINKQADEEKKIENDKLISLELLKLNAIEREKSAEQNTVLEKQLKAEESYQFLADNLGREEALREIARAEDLAKTSGTNAAKLSLNAAYYKAQQNQVGFYKKWEDQTNKERVSTIQSTLGAISTLTASSNAELFEIGKAAAVAQATTDGILAVQKAYASAPPPFGFALAALVGVATAANVARIASQKRPKFAQGGIVGGTSTSGDKITAQLNSREMVLTQSQQATLFNMANNGGSGNGMIEAIDRLGQKIQNMTLIVQADGREIAKLVRDQKQAGFVL